MQARDKPRTCSGQARGRRGAGRGQPGDRLGIRWGQAGGLPYRSCVGPAAWSSYPWEGRRFRGPPSRLARADIMPRHVPSLFLGEPATEARTGFAPSAMPPSTLELPLPRFCAGRDAALNSAAAVDEVWHCPRPPFSLQLPLPRFCPPEASRDIPRPRFCEPDASRDVPWPKMVIPIVLLRLTRSPAAIEVGRFSVCRDLGLKEHEVGGAKVLCKDEDIAAFRDHIEAHGVFDQNGQRIDVMQLRIRHQFIDAHCATEGLHILLEFCCRRDCVRVSWKSLCLVRRVQGER